MRTGASEFHAKSVYGAVSVNVIPIEYVPGLSVSQWTTGRKYTVVGVPTLGAPVSSVPPLAESAVEAPVGVRLQWRSLTGLLVQAPLLAVHRALLPLTEMLHVLLPWTVRLAIEPVATPSTTSMSATVAVDVSVADGDTVNWMSAGFVIVAGLANETSDEHLPAAPDTVHVVCPGSGMAAIAASMAAQMRELRGGRLIAHAPGARETYPTRRFRRPTLRSNYR
jgi:hypothetical protein